MLRAVCGAVGSSPACCGDAARTAGPTLAEVAVATLEVAGGDDVADTCEGAGAGTGVETGDGWDGGDASAAAEDFATGADAAASADPTRSVPPRTTVCATVRAAGDRTAEGMGTARGVVELLPRDPAPLRTPAALPSSMGCTAGGAWDPGSMNGLPRP